MFIMVFQCSFAKKNFMRHLKTSILIIALAITSTQVKAQVEGQSQINVGYGIASSNQISKELDKVIITVGSLGTITYGDAKSNGVINANYRYSISDKLNIGVSGAYEKITQDAFVLKQKEGKLTSNIFTVAAEGNYKYISGPMLQLYSGVGLGLSVVQQKLTKNDNTSEKASKSQFAYNITGLGVRYGKAFGVYAEVGYGYKGVANVGLSFQF